ncbi:MAG: hypothetical protein P4M15_03340 [Alphaproteobacteria bacterium]|nr:hypothetical protein [Alphaproteobacteria bacterium]
MMDYSNEPFYPRLVSGSGSARLLAKGFTPPEGWARQVGDAFAATVPRQIRLHLEKKNWTSCVTLWPADIPANAKEFLTRTEIDEIVNSDDPRYLPEHVNGICFSDQRVVFSAHTYSNRGIRGKEPPLVIVPPEEMTGVLRHETGHAIMLAFAALEPFQRKFAESARQDIVALGGFDRMRSIGLRYFTPSTRRPERALEEIFAESMAAAWGGGCNSAKWARKFFAASCETCAEFSTFLSYASPYQAANWQSAPRQTLDDKHRQWLLNSEGGRLRKTALINIGFFEALKSGIYKLDIPAVTSQQVVDLMHGMRRNMEKECGNGLPYADLLLSPVNVVVILAQELVRKSLAAGTAAEMLALWDDFDARFQPSNETAATLRIDYGLDIMRLQMKLLAPRERKAFGKKLVARARARRAPKDDFVADLHALYHMERNVEKLLGILAAARKETQPNAQPPAATPRKRPKSLPLQAG